MLTSEWTASQALSRGAARAASGALEKTLLAKAELFVEFVMCFMFVPQPKRDCATLCPRATLAPPLPNESRQVPNPPWSLSRRVG